MLKYLRYTLATFCFAASAGCLAFWEWSRSSGILCQACCYIDAKLILIESADGIATASLRNQNPYGPIEHGWWTNTFDLKAAGVDLTTLRPPELIGVTSIGCFFPLWYPALVFALAGVAALRFRRQFSIRSAMICVSVVAFLMGMVVIL